MGTRIGTFSTYRRVLYGLRQNQLASLRAQEQLSSGLRILRPSDDPTGTARAIRLQRQLSGVERYRRAITQGQNTVDAGASALTGSSDLMAQARQLLIQGMNGTLAPEDRAAIAEEFELIRSQLLDQANQRSGHVYLFGGAATDTRPFVEVTEDGRTRVVYRGDGGSQVIEAGDGIDVPITLAGGEVFGRFEPTGTVFGGPTGAAAGLTADEGTGFARLDFRHDATDLGGLAALGIASAAGGALDTLLGPNALEIDAAAGTIRLGSGPAVPLPATPEADFVVVNELGGELHLDLTSYAGGGYSGTVTGEGSVSLDGTSYTPLGFGETDLELVDEAGDRVVHVDTTGVRRAGEELVEFGGTSNVFDLLQEIAEDLRNEDGLDGDRLGDRLEARLGEIDRHHENVLVGVGTLGSRSQRLQVSDERSADLDLQLQGLLSNVADADLAEVALDLSRTDYLLQLAQAAGARVLQTSLLNYL